jgi:hypothetical protein
VDKATSSALIVGLTDAAGFLVGALAGALLSHLLGFKFMDQAGYGMGVLAGIAIVGLGGGLGLRFARRWRERRSSKP